MDPAKRIMSVKEAASKIKEALDAEIRKAEERGIAEGKAAREEANRALAATAAEAVARMQKASQARRLAEARCEELLRENAGLRGKLEAGRKMVDG